jgi:hypothetical protein
VSEFALNASEAFPAGSMIGAYDAGAFVSDADYSAAAPCSPLVQAPMEASGRALFSGLESSREYVAGCRVTGRMRYVRFRTASLSSLTAGPRGETGAQGLQGVTGATGATGSVGAQGATGERGVTGAQGAAGARGAAGSQGTTGSQGVQGATGAQGVPGVAGEQGAKGVQGERGATGETGAKGLTGEVGAKGTTGEAGASFAANAPVTGISITSGTPLQPSASLPCAFNVLATLSGLLGSGVVTVSTSPTKEGTYTKVGQIGLTLATGVSLGESNDLVFLPTGYWLKAVVTGVTVGNVALSGVRWDL